MIAANSKKGDLVWMEEDRGNILRQGVVIGIDGDSNLLLIVWDSSPGTPVWEDSADLDYRAPKESLCPCICHEMTSFKTGIQTHKERCICNAGTGFTEI